ncbi:hypothetical protein O3P69_010517 [Scylla paramamosain]|uniref:Uncharacterized protein n=1 Tax=Scylla paramamosain TaxID=85552 RepID=A0AAW0TT27_SCYPA
MTHREAQNGRGRKGDTVALSGTLTEAAVITQVSRRPTALRHHHKEYGPKSGCSAMFRHSPLDRSPRGLDLAVTSPLRPAPRPAQRSTSESEYQQTPLGDIHAATYKPALEVPLGRRSQQDKAAKSEQRTPARKDIAKHITLGHAGREGASPAALSGQHAAVTANSHSVSLTLPHWDKRAWVAMVCEKGTPPPTMARDQLRAAAGTHPALPTSLPPTLPPSARPARPHLPGPDLRSGARHAPPARLTVARLVMHTGDCEPVSR